MKALLFFIFICTTSIAALATNNDIFIESINNELQQQELSDNHQWVYENWINNGSDFTNPKYIQKLHRQLNKLPNQPALACSILAELTLEQWVELILESHNDITFNCPFTENQFPEGHDVQIVGHYLKPFDQTTIKDNREFFDGPAYLCNGRLFGVELLVCEYKEFYVMDRYLNQTFNHLANTLESDLRKDLFSNQIDWLRQRNNCGRNRNETKRFNCVSGKYLSRIAHLYKIKSEQKDF